MYRRNDQVERRQASRSAAEGAVTLGWWDGPEYRTTDATLRDISIGGARLAVRTAVPAGAPIWLYLHGGDLEGWVEGVIVKVSRHWLRPHVLQLRFVQPCPYEYFAAAAAGCHLKPADPAPPEEHFRDYYWK